MNKMNCFLFAAFILVAFEAVNADSEKKTSVANERKRSRYNEVDNRQATSNPDDDFLVQRREEPDPAWLEKQRQKIAASKNKTRASYKPTLKRVISRANGRSCKFNTDCMSGCCQINKRTNRRKCSPLALVGQRCEIAEVKGGAYFGYCPCASGFGGCEYNKRKNKYVGICSA